MDPKMQLKRFCFLGSFEPVYVHLRGYVDVDKYFKTVTEKIKDIDDTDFLKFMSEMLGENTLVRRDEALFLYAAYLTYLDKEDNKDKKEKTCKDIQSSVANDACQEKEKLDQEMRLTWKKEMRHSFSILVRTDDDFFLFCKYSTMIRTYLGKKWISRTLRKAVQSWYLRRTPDELRTMWSSNRGLHGLTHKLLITLCHVSDEVIGSEEVSSPFFITCTELIKETDAKKAASAQIEEPLSSNVVATCNNSKKNKRKQKEHPVATPKPSPVTLLEAIARIRTTKSKNEVVRLVRKFQLSPSQIPGNWMYYPNVLELVLPRMSYLQILRYWRKLARNNYFKDKSKLLELFKKYLEDNELAKKSRIYPIHLLMSLHNIINGNMGEIPAETVRDTNLEYFEKLYKQSFDWPVKPGNLRMHITLNLQTNYKKKILKNLNKLDYFSACIALSLGYGKREAHVDVFHWCEDRSNLKRIQFDSNFSTSLGFPLLNSIVNRTNNQLLVNPIRTSLNSEQVYDLFLCIVPTAGRGNPKNSSDYLRGYLDKYRQSKNPKARFVILNLMKFRRSMTYSTTLSENILEICGLDRHTTDIIHNFATYRFD